MEGAPTWVIRSPCPTAWTLQTLINTVSRSRENADQSQQADDHGPSFRMIPNESHQESNGRELGKADTPHFKITDLNALLNYFPTLFKNTMCTNQRTIQVKGL